MSLKVFLALIILGTIISWSSFGLVIFYFDPEQIGPLGFGIFYLSLFLSLSGAIFLLSDWLKAKIFKKQLLFIRLRNSVRHAIIFTALILGWAILQSQDLLHWWNLLLFILILTVVEFFFMSSNKQQRLYEGTDSTTQRTV